MDRKGTGTKGADKFMIPEILAHCLWEMTLYFILSARGGGRWRTNSYNQLYNSLNT